MNTEWIKEQYEDRKQRVQSLLVQARDYYAAIDMQEQAQSFETLHNHLENGYFSIVVIGEFSAGKSTFLNALMGEKYLPSFTNETTATVNFLRHKDVGPEGYGSAIYYKDANKQPHYSDASVQTIERFVSTSSDLHVADEIDRVELFLDSAFLNDGVMLVDSPGLNGVAEGHREITERQIEKSHACIFMFSADQPGKKTDFEFLTSLRAKVDTIILVLNKIDVIKPNEQSVEDVIDNLRNSYRKYFPDQPIPEIWPVAAYPALVARSGQSLSYRGKNAYSSEERQEYLAVSRMEAFEQRLWRFLIQGEKTRQELYAPVDRVKKVLIARTNELDELKQDLIHAVDTRNVELEIETLEEEIRQVEEKITDKKQALLGEINQIVKDTRVLLGSRTRDMKQRLIGEVHEWTDLNQVQQDVEQFNKKIVRQYHEIANQVHQRFLDEFMELLQSRYREYQQQIESEVSARLDGIQFQLHKGMAADSFNFHFGLEEYRTLQERYEQELEELEERMHAVMDERLQADEERNRRAELEQKIEGVRQREQAYKAAFGPRPTSQRFAKEYTEKTSRGGIFGGVSDVLFGKKEVTRIDYVTDDSARQEYDAEMLKIERQFEQEATELRKKIEAVAEPQKGTEQYRQEMLRLEKIMLKKRQEQERIEEEFKEQFQKKHAAALRRVRNEIEDFVDALEKEAEELLVKELRKQRNQLCDIAVDSIQNNLQELILRKQNQLKTRKQQLESTVDEKEMLIQRCDQEMETIREVLTEAVSLAAELEMIEVDIISMDK
ncbi:dynamin family protein [Paenibacillus sp. JJ-223]|uniref:dynamin family protein n=1 Tax=Paenibacillus sp. JJ-223 TaxID=2905647 RepID=UPI001F22A8BA|nr:dynamin family protein [Paenibacillus sp. JJ-223]CAH1221739.1 GTPase Der [Paenibacillus sp. JJ-223]